METQEARVVQDAASEAEELAAMEAVFTSEGDSDGGAVVVADPTEEPAAESATTEAPAEAEQPQQFSMAEVQALIEAVKAEQKAEISKLHDKTFGKIGDLQQRIDTIRATYNFSPKAKERLSAEFPELVDMLFDDEPIPTQMPTAAPKVELPQFNVADIVDAKTKEIAKNFEIKLLRRDHPDYRQIIESGDYQAWIETLPEDQAFEVQTSTDADYCSQQLTVFKQWRDAQAAKAQKTRANQERIESAVVPQGMPRNNAGGDDDEETAMLAAFGKRHRL